MKQKLTRLLSMVLCMAMLIGVFPFSAMAASYAVYMKGDDDNFKIADGNEYYIDLDDGMIYEDDEDGDEIAEITISSSRGIKLSSISALFSISSSSCELVVEFYTSSSSSSIVDHIYIDPDDYDEIYCIVYVVDDDDYEDYEDWYDYGYYDYFYEYEDEEECSKAIYELTFYWNEDDNEEYSVDVDVVFEEENYLDPDDFYGSSKWTSVMDILFDEPKYGGIYDEDGDEITYNYDSGRTLYYMDEIEDLYYYCDSSTAWSKGYDYMDFMIYKNSTLMVEGTMYFYFDDSSSNSGITVTFSVESGEKNYFSVDLFDDSDDIDLSDYSTSKVYFRVESLPTSGSLYDGDDDKLSRGDEIKLSSIDDIYYYRSASSTSTCSMTFSLIYYKTSSSSGTYLVKKGTLYFAFSTDTAASFTKEFVAGTGVTFTAADFENNFTASSSTSSLAYVKIVTLPSSGTLYLGTTEVSEGDVISVGKLGTLIYVPDTSSVISDSFTYSATSGSVYSNTATITLEGIYNTLSLYDDEDLLESLDVEYGDTIALEDLTEPEKTGYTFNGWLDADGNAVTEDITVTGDISLYASWVSDSTDDSTEILDGGTSVSVSDDAEIDEDMKDAVLAAAGGIAADPDVLADSVDQEIDSDLLEKGLQVLIENGILNEDSSTDDVIIYTQVYLEVIVKSYAVGETYNSMTMDITPVSVYVASAASAAEEVVTEGDEANSVILTDTAAELTVTDVIEISVPLPTGFISSAEQSVYVQHGRHEYQTEVSGDEETGYTITFENPDGFSEFTISTASLTVAVIDSTNYTSLQAAVDAAEDGDSIVLTADCEETVTVSETKTFTLVVSEDCSFTGSIVPADGLQITEDNGMYTIATISTDDTGNMEDDTDDTGNTEDTGDSGDSEDAGDDTEDTGDTENTEDTGDTDDADDADTDDTDDTGTSEETVTYTVTYHGNGGKKSGETTITEEYEEDEEVEISGKLFRRSGYYFTGWNTKANGRGVDYDPGDEITLTEDLDLYAQWRLVIIDDDDDDDDDDDEDEEEEEEDDDEDEEILGTLIRIPSDTSTTIRFTDVPTGSYFEDAVAWALENGITTGTTKTTFGPYESVTRAQLVTFLYRLAGSPSVSGMSTPFTDISGTDCEAYYDAIVWAYNAGITTGTSETSFSPAEAVTRAQVVTFLYRYYGEPSYDGLISNFTDIDSEAYYSDATAWAIANGITTGTSSTAFSPTDPCTRAQSVTFLYRAEN